MAFRASNIVTAGAYEAAKGAALRAKQTAQTYSTAFAAATTPRSRVVECWQEFSGHSAALNAYKLVPGLVAYARDQENDQAYDVAAEFNALIAAVDAVVARVVVDFPKDGANFLAVFKFGANAQLEYGTLTTAQLATLKGLLDAVAAQVT